ncbi:MAG: four helix bundle protein [Spirochaetales bacterium]|jgi:four helix bundle protein|nr:four helix bundle protein [Spirochaetales bacterium]
MKLKSNFRDLNVWQNCRDIRIAIWKLCKKFPAEEKYRLVDQMIRASRSSTANIAEGYGRYHFQENIQFCRQSRGSLYELIDHVLTAKECEYIDQGKCELLIKEVVSAIRLLNGYIKYLKTQKERA